MSDPRPQTPPAATGPQPELPGSFDKTLNIVQGAIAQTAELLAQVAEQPRRTGRVAAAAGHLADAAAALVRERLRRFPRQGADEDTIVLHNEPMTEPPPGLRRGGPPTLPGAPDGWSDARSAVAASLEALLALAEAARSAGDRRLLTVTLQAARLADRAGEYLAPPQLAVTRD